MKAIRTPIQEMLADDTPAPGAICFEDDSMLYACPGCGELRSVPVHRPEDGEVWPHGVTSWTWTGGDEAPTLMPSIRQLDGCKWHGFLTAGEWRACEDGPPNADGSR